MSNSIDKDCEDFWNSNSIAIELARNNEKHLIKPVHVNNNYLELVLPNLQYSDNTFLFNFNKNIGIINNYNVPKKCPITLKEKYKFIIKNIELSVKPLKKNYPYGLLTEIGFPKSSDILASDIITNAKNIELLLLGLPREDVLNNLFQVKSPIPINKNDIFDEEIFETKYNIDKIIEELNNSDNGSSTPSSSSDDENEEMIEM